MGVSTVHCPQSSRCRDRGRRIVSLAKVADRDGDFVLSSVRATREDGHDTDPWVETEVGRLP